MFTTLLAHFLRTRVLEYYSVVLVTFLNTLSASREWMNRSHVYIIVYFRILSFFFYYKTGRLHNNALIAFLLHFFARRHSYNEHF